MTTLVKCEISTYGVDHSLRTYLTVIKSMNNGYLFKLHCLNIDNLKDHVTLHEKGNDLW
jgi:hypothetical protein